MTADQTIGAIRLAVAAQLTGITGLRVYDVYPGVVNPPAAVVRRTNTDYATEFNGGDTHQIAVSLYLPAADTISSQSLLDTYLSRAGPLSVVNALSVDSTLGGIVRSATVTSVSEEGLVELQGVTYLSAMIPMIVISE